MAGLTGSKDQSTTTAPPATTAPDPKSTGSKVTEGLRGQPLDQQTAVLTPRENTRGRGSTDVGGKRRAEPEAAPAHAPEKDPSQKDRLDARTELRADDARKLVAGFLTGLRAFQPTIVTYGEVHGSTIIGGLGLRSSSENTLRSAMGACGDKKVSELGSLLGVHLSGIVDGWTAGTRVRPDCIAFPAFASWSESAFAPPTRSAPLMMYDFFDGPSAGFANAVASAARDGLYTVGPELAQGLDAQFAQWKQQLTAHFTASGNVRSFPTAGPVEGPVMSLPAFL